MIKVRKSTNAVQQFVKTLTKEQVRQIIHDYDVMSVEGYIGECELRTQAKTLMKQLCNDSMVIMWMESLYKECLAAIYYGELND